MHANSLVTLAGVVAIFVGCIWLGQKINDGIERAYLKRTKDFPPQWLQALAFAVNGTVAFGLGYYLVTA